MADRAQQVDSSGADHAGYTVVARRYRPKSFAELVGQEHIGQALSKAIATGRVGHAYLFTGARGVGKTSSARIFAKALNAPDGPTSEPVAGDDVSEAIDAGEDVDVIEIDGASNRGIDEIRQLRANVSVRPSRSRYKIYIIDEVHMLTQQAFNALLKTLEEPPEHVKFIFCTTDPEKIPITVLSRCQRFDFAPVQTDAIKGRLAEICRSEGFEADDDALAMLARRAAGSMRDSQSLLEQVMSFSSGKITLDQVNMLLGTADESRLRELTELLVDRDAAGALHLVAAAVAAGTDSGQLAEQLLSYFRDLMAVAVGASRELLKLANPSNYDALKELAQRWGLQTILSAVQLLDESLVRMRTSVQSQALFEVALIQITQLQDLAAVAKLLEALSAGGPLPTLAAVARPAPAEKKKPEPVVASTVRESAASPESDAQSAPSQPRESNTVHTVAAPSASGRRGEDAQPHVNRAEESPSTEQKEDSPPPSISVAGSTVQESSQPVVPQVSGDAPSPASQQPSAKATDGSALSIWNSAVEKVDGMLADFARMAIQVECTAADEWAVIFPAGHNKTLEYCEVPQRKQALQEALTAATGRTIHILLRVQPGQPVRTKVDVPVSATVVRSQMMRQMSEHPFVSKVCELFQGEVVRVDPPQPSQPRHLDTTAVGPEDN
ncbi:MAG: DNA polymerase III subunit gamma/tau [Pirellulales bacterium]